MRPSDRHRGEPQPERCDLDMQLTGIDSHLHELLLRLGKLKPQLDILGREDQ